MSESVKKALKNSFFQTFGAFAITGLNFILMLVYARVLGPESFGSLITSQAQVLIWLILVDLGLYNGLISALTAADKQKETDGRQSYRARDLVARVLFLRLGGAVVGSVFIAMLAYIHANESAGWSQARFLQDIAFTPHLFAIALQQTAAAYAGYRERQDLGVIAILIGILCTVVLSITLALHNASIPCLLLAQSWGGLLAGGIIFAYFLRERAQRKREEGTRRVEKTVVGPWREEAWTALVKDTWPHAIVFACMTLWQRLDQIAVSHFLGFEAGGNYGLSVRLVSILILIATSVFAALFPDMQRVGRDAPDKITAFLGVVTKLIYRYGIVLAGVTVLFLGWAISLVLPKFEIAIKLLPWFVPGIWAFWLQSFFMNSLYSLKAYKSVVFVHAISFGLYALSLPVLATLFGAHGVAISFDLFCLMLFLNSYRAAKKNKILTRDFSFFAPFNEAELAFFKKLKFKRS